MLDYLYSITPTELTGSKVRPEPDTGNTALAIGLPLGKYAYGNRRITIAEDKYEIINGESTQVNKAGDVWLEVLEVDGTKLTQQGYIAEIHLGQRFATITELGTPPPTDPTFPPEIGIVINGVTKIYVPKP
jgi:hypothetical protein